MYRVIRRALPLCLFCLLLGVPLTGCSDAGSDDDASIVVPDISPDPGDDDASGEDPGDDDSGDDDSGDDDASGEDPGDDDASGDDDSGDDDSGDDDSGDDDSGDDDSGDDDASGDDDSGDDDSTTPDPNDHDLDGVPAPLDCDDDDPLAYPGALELCDGTDNNCNGVIDDGFDLDGDAVSICAVPPDCDDADSAVYPGASEQCNDTDDDCDPTTTDSSDVDGDGLPACPEGTGAGDCNDVRADVYPGALELCDGEDNDCDGPVDEGLDTSLFYRDADQDGYGDPSKPVSSCAMPDGYVADASDCDDVQASIHPGAPEACNFLDDDCDGLIDEGVTQTVYRDEDHDGYGDASNSTDACALPAGYATNGDDCDDTNTSIHPDAPEQCNSIDDDCDGVVDDNPVDTTFYRDADGDGYGDPAQTSSGCLQPDGYVASGGDCNDASPLIHPAAVESCNNVDDNCNGVVDEGAQTLYYPDDDGDGWGDSSAAFAAACTRPAGYVTDHTDCDDARASVHPGAPEACNGLDDDCDGVVDEGVLTLYFRDADGDGYGTATQPATACSAPAGYVEDSADCDDTRASVHPGALESCNGLDDDCDGSIDDGVQTDYYPDVDGDGYGATNGTAVQACSAPGGYVANARDCDDSTTSISPAALESCNGLDDDCDGQVDDGTGSTWYADVDQDGYGSANATTLACTQPTGYTSNAGDCLDSNAAVHPGAAESCNGRDDDCDGVVDEGTAGQSSTWYADKDKDGFGDPASTTLSCAQPAGYVLEGTDCNDTDATAYPGATEACDNVDDDCDGILDEGFDQDGDGYTSCDLPKADCDDTNAATNPGAIERCDGRDSNCDGNVDGEWKTPLGTGMSVKAGAASAGADGSTAHPYPTVQQGIDAAGDGCLNVSVAVGTYTENINFKGKAAVVVAAGAASSTVIDGGAKDSVVRFQSGEGRASTLKGFTLRNGSAVNGGGVYCANSSPTVQNNVIQANYATAYGGGVFLSSSSALLSDNTISTNQAKSGGDGRGGGIYAYSGRPELTNNVIKSNVAFYFGGGVALYGGSQPTIRGGELSLNTAGTYTLAAGGGLYASESYPFVDQVKIDGNIAQSSGGGIYVAKATSSSAIAVFEDGVISANKVTSGSGGGIYVTGGGSIQITRMVVTRNTATLSAGGLYAASSDLELSNSVVHCNRGGPTGGGLYFDTSYPDILNNTILENDASANGGGIYLYDSVSSPLGAIITDNVIYKNGKYGISHAGASSAYVISYNDVQGNEKGNYDGIPDQKNKNGNIDSEPKFTTYTKDCQESGDNLLPASNSPLLDAGKDTGLGIDLAGTVRPRDGDGDGKSAYDIGAYER